MSDTFGCDMASTTCSARESSHGVLAPPPPHEFTERGGGARLPRRSGRARSSGPFSGNCVRHTIKSNAIFCARTFVCLSDCFDDCVCTRRSSDPWLVAVGQVESRRAGMREGAGRKLSSRPRACRSRTASTPRAAGASSMSRGSAPQVIRGVARSCRPSWPPEQQAPVRATATAGPMGPARSSPQEHRSLRSTWTRRPGRRLGRPQPAR